MDSSKPKPNIIEYLILSMAGVLFVCGIILSFQSKAATAISTYGAAVLCLIFSSLSMFQSFKGLGVEAVLKDKIAEADKLIDHLKSYVLPTSELIISNIASSNRWSAGLTRRDKYDLFSRLSSSMREVGITDIEIEAAKKMWHRFNLFDLSDSLFKSFDEVIKPKIQALQEESNNIPQPISSNNHEKLRELLDSIKEMEEYRQGFHNLRQNDDLFALDSEIESYLNDGSVLDASEVQSFLDANQECLKDIKHYIATKEFRRPDVWFNGQ